MQGSRFDSVSQAGLGYVGSGSVTAQREAMNAPVLPTIAGVCGKIEGVNTRLDQALKDLEAIADQIGGPRPASGVDAINKVGYGGVVGRLHDAADRAHDRMGEIEGVVAGIQRLLG